MVSEVSGGGAVAAAVSSSGGGFIAGKAPGPLTKKVGVHPSHSCRRGSEVPCSAISWHVLSWSANCFPERVFGIVAL